MSFTNSYRYGSSVTPQPPNTSDLNWWFDFSDSANLTLSGTNVLGANNLSTKTNRWPDATGVNNPQYDSVNGSVTFNGTNNYLESTADNSPMVGSPFLSTSGAYAYVVEFDAITSISFHFGLTTSGVNSYNLGGIRNTDKIYSWSNGYMDAGIIASSVVATTGQKYLFYVECDGVDASFYIDGALISTVTTNDNWISATTDLSVTMGGVDIATRRYAPGKCYEFLGYQSGLTSGERSDLFDYLNNKYTIY